MIDDSGATALHWAAEAGDVETVRRLINDGADLEALDRWFGLGPLGWSTLVRRTAADPDARRCVADLLLEAGAQLDPFSAVARGDIAALRTMGGLDRRLLFGGFERQA